MCMSTSCVISPPIDSEPIAPDRSPRLDFMDPPTRIVTITSDEPVTLSVRAFDENPHDFLEVVWLGEELGATSLNVSRQSDELEDGELEYRFDVIARTIQSPCTSLEGVTRETVTVYVADAPLDLTGNNVELSDPFGGGFITAATWILDLRPEACL